MHSAIPIHVAFLVGLLAAAAALVFIATNPSSSQAGPNGSCQNGEVCVWSGNDFEDCWRDMSADENNYLTRVYVNCDGTSLHDTINSVKNRGNCAVKMFRDTHRNGPWFRLAPGDAPDNKQDGNLSNGVNAAAVGNGGSFDGDWHNRLDSHNFCPGD
jgi:hypothetical protein